MPRVLDTAESPERPSAAAGRLDGTETILLAEDEEGVRTLLQRTLQHYGYRVLVSENGLEAQQIAASYPDTIHLLLPERPEMCVLYASGDTDSDILRHSANNPRAAVLQKPFTPDKLIREVRQGPDSYRPPSARAAGGRRHSAG